VKKILIIHQSAELYGSDKMLLLFLTHLNKSRFQAVVVIPSNGPLKAALENLTIEVHIAPVLKIFRAIIKPKNQFIFVKQFRSSLKFLGFLHEKHQFDLVYSNTLAVLLGLFFARKFKIKHLWHVHEIIVHPKIIASLFPKLLNQYADVIVCNSVATQNNLTERIPGLKQKIALIYNGIECNNIEISIAKKSDYGFSEAQTVVTLVGRISRLKGHLWVLETLVSELKVYQEIVFLFVGSPVADQEFYLENILKFIETHQLEKRVKILPFTANLADIWKVTDIAVMPSTEAESFGLVAAEAMLAQKPVIASNLGGLAEIILHNQTGLLVTPFDKLALKEAILKLHLNPDLQTNFGKKGKEFITKNFDIQKHVKQLENLFESF
jgi:glycosyltransferase involved in cell wall biosynthesis